MIIKPLNQACASNPHIVRISNSEASNLDDHVYNIGTSSISQQARGSSTSTTPLMGRVVRYRLSWGNAKSIFCGRSTDCDVGLPRIFVYSLMGLATGIFTYMISSQDNPEKFAIAGAGIGGLFAIMQVFISGIVNTFSPSENKYFCVSENDFRCC